MVTAKHSGRGFTLLELLIALALFATLATIAIPNFARIIQENRVITTANDYKIALSYARSEAVRRNQSIRLQPVADGWSAGWEVTDNTTQLRTWSQTQPDISVNGAPESFTFNSQGRLATADFVSQDVSIALEELGRCIRVEPSGISRVLSRRQACD
ncbi:GspH/FimT family pseudopilin [Halomonas alkaliantarctica]|uniref:GspH/FimT family pseudopilin n=1 Tax=Halomonas alkaliantarctica TaxID=232346 RepID=UPI0004AA7160|nr:GspH/FimT family protein [Halomonas alkaliantarctica]